MQNKENKNQSFADFEKVMEAFENRLPLVESDKLSKGLAHSRTLLIEELDEAKKRWQPEMHDLEDKINRLQNDVLKIEISHATSIVGWCDKQIAMEEKAFGRDKDNNPENQERLNDAIAYFDEKKVAANEMIVDHQQIIASAGKSKDALQNNTHSNSGALKAFKDNANTFVKSAVDGAGEKLQSVKDAIKNTVNAVKDKISR